LQRCRRRRLTSCLSYRPVTIYLAQNGNEIKLQNDPSGSTVSARLSNLTSASCNLYVDLLISEVDRSMLLLCALLVPIYIKTGSFVFNPLMGTLKPQSNGPLYSNAIIRTLAADGWAVTFWYIEEGPGRAAVPPSPLLAVVTAHPTTASVPTSYYSMWHYNYQCPLKG